MTKDKEVLITLKFKNEDEAGFFMANLCSGDGENMCSLKWEGAFHEAHTFEVDPTVSEAWEENLHLSDEE